MLDYSEGLRDKYTVTKNDTGDDVPGAFVLQPETDPIAAAAVMFYADITKMLFDLSPLLVEVELWLESVENKDGTGTMKEAGTKLYNRVLDGICTQN